MDIVDTMKKASTGTDSPTFCGMHVKIGRRDVFYKVPYAYLGKDIISEHNIEENIYSDRFEEKFENKPPVSGIFKSLKDWQNLCAQVVASTPEEIEVRFIDLMMIVLLFDLYFLNVHIMYSSP